jgi:imidazolonepropionase-like amidohydrolase
MLALVLLAFVLAGSSPAPGADSEKLAIRFGALIDGTGKVQRDAVVTVTGDRIEAVTSGGKGVPSGAKVIDLRRYTGFPGLIDAHTHMTYYWDRTDAADPFAQLRSERLPAVTVFLAQDNAKRCLESGVTTVRDLGSTEYADIAMRDLINKGAMIGPRMFVAGHGLHITYASARPPSGPPFAGVADGPAAVMRIVRQEVFGAGTDVVKMYASTGTGSDVSSHQTFTFEEIKAAVDAAHALGVKIAVHSYGPEGARDAVRAGADSIEHATGLDDATIAEMARKGTFYVPTIDHNRYYADNAALFGYDAAAVAGLRAFIERNLETARRAHKAGVRFAMGSDALFTMFAENTRELEWFVKAGMTPQEALSAATRNGAQLLGKETELGGVAPGYYADIVAVEGDPLADIGVVVRNVRWVMKGGTVVVDRRERADQPAPAGR